VEVVDAHLGPELDALLASRAADLRAAGQRPYVWDRHHVQPLAAVSYALCLAELLDQLHARGLEPGAIYISSAGGTGTGMALGKALLGLRCPVRLIGPIRWPWDVCADLAGAATRAADLLGLPHRIQAADVDASDAYIGEAYGKPTAAGQAALQLLAMTEGILLDPVYSAKAMAALIDDVGKERVGSDEVVVFVHTGGTPAVFAYRDEVLAGYPSFPL
jgi:1-aminocyclopropane-1-carboxylate deaminase/D-cysteine desulfhydrase-like pyridoxal-dependent ACC family enzyme